jgi:hypothetical protein
MALAYQRYDLMTNLDGTITGWAETNDDQDLGIPNDFARWECNYGDRETALRICGKSRMGWSGVEVIVTIDGRRV